MSEVGSHLHDFKDENLIVLVESQLLGETISLVSSRGCVAHVPDGIPTYLPDELTFLADKGCEVLKQVHQLKTRFGGEVISVEPIQVERRKRRSTPRSRNKEEYCCVLSETKTSHLAHVHGNKVARTTLCGLEVTSRSWRDSIDTWKQGKHSHCKKCEKIWEGV